MHNVLFSVVFIKHGGGAKVLYPSVRTYTYICTSGCVSRDNDIDVRQRQ